MPCLTTPHPLNTSQFPSYIIIHKDWDLARAEEGTYWVVEGDEQAIVITSSLLHGGEEGAKSLPDLSAARTHSSCIGDAASRKHLLDAKSLDTILPM